MDNFVCIHDLANELLNLLVVHLPNLVEPDLVALLEALELLLQLFELAGKLLVVSR